MRKATVLGLLVFAGTLASPAFADEFTGFRLALNLSSERLEGDLFFDPLLATESVSGDRFGYGLSAGWALNKWLAFEAGLMGGGDFSDHPFSLASPTDDIVSRTDVKGGEISVVGSLWIGRKFAFFGRAGMLAWKADEKVVVTNGATGAKASASVDDTGFDPIFGAGIQTVLDGALMRLEYKYTEIGDLGAAGSFNLHDNSISSLNFSIVWTL